MGKIDQHKQIEGENVNILIKLNKLDFDMAECYKKDARGNTMLVCVFHRDCLDDISVLNRLEEGDEVKAVINFEV